MKNKPYYFPHDYYARNDRKLIKLKMKYRMAGLGIYWSIVEMLYEESGKIALSEIATIAAEFKEKESTVLAVIHEFDLFQKDDNFFWSESVKRRLDERSEKSEKAKASAAQRWSNAGAMRTHTGRNANKGKGKERKRKEEGFQPPTVDEVKAYFLSNGYQSETGEKAFKLYEAGDWSDTQGNKILNWKQKMIQVWFKDEHKITIPVKRMVI